MSRRHVGPPPGTDGPTDSLGVPWAGRALGPQPFAGDPGDADPALLAALTGHAAGEQSEQAVLAALASARLLVPVLAAAGEGHPLPDRVRGDAGAEASIPLVAGPDGSTALPAFTSVAAMAAWDGAARPVPVESARAALSAVDEGCSAILIDPATAHAFVVRRPPLWALAQGRDWVPPHQDRAIAAAVAAALGADPAIPGVVGVGLDAGRRAELAVVIRLVPGLDQAALAEGLAAVGERLAGLELLTERAASIELRPVADPARTDLGSPPTGS